MDKNPAWPSELSTPPYAFVPGHWPHPVLHSDGHRFGRPVPAVTAPCSNGWTKLPGWQHALALFDDGYYWEAHEHWEAFWISAERTDAIHRVLSGLILLAAAAIKLRQGHDEVARGILNRAIQKWCEVDSAAVYGWQLAVLIEFAEDARDSLSSATLDPKRTVETVYARRLATCFCAA